MDAGQTRSGVGPNGSSSTLKNEQGSWSASSFKTGQLFSHRLLERQYSVLLVSSSENFSRSLISLLPESIYGPITAVTCVADAKRRLLERSFDVVIINTPLPDEFGIDFAFEICSDGGMCALVFVRADLYAEVYAHATPHGVLTLTKPASGQVILQTLALLCSVRERLRLMEAKTASVQEKMQEIGIVNHAKLLLIEQLKMTEAEAHRYIEKQAMDRCVTRRVIAEGIIATRG